MITSTISSKGQVTIPKKIREVLGLGTFDKIVFIPLEKGKVMITNKQIPVSDLFGMLKHLKPKQPVSVEKNGSSNKGKKIGKGHKLIALDTNALVRMLIEDDENQALAVKRVTV